MPRIVDPHERRVAIAEAVWRVIRRDGLEHASVRNVAREAGLSIGSLRHYFASQTELLAFTMRLVIDRVGARMLALPETGDPRTRVESVVEQLLPVDAERRAETEIWLVFTGRALVDPALRALRDESDTQLQDLFAGLIALLVDSGRASSHVDIRLEAERLGALVDGLAVHGAIRSAGDGGTDPMAIVRRHLDELCD